MGGAAFSSVKNGYYIIYIVSHAAALAAAKNQPAKRQNELDNANHQPAKAKSELAKAKKPLGK